ncbi:MAG: DNA polymerase III subunit delta [Endomicrobiia bacterium]
MKRKFYYKEFGDKIPQLLKEANIFFFYGPNNYSMIEILDKIFSSFDTISKDIIYSWETNIEEVAKKLTTMELFSNNTVVVLRYFDRSNKTFRKNLIEFLKEYKFHNYLFILYEKELLVKEKDETIDFLLESFILVEYPQLTKEEIIENFIPERANFPLSDEAKEALFENTGSDLWLLSNEIEKLSYFVGGKKIVSKEDVERCCNEYEIPEIKDLIEAIISNTVSQKFNILNQLISNNYTALGVINSLYRYFRKNFLFKKISLLKAYKILKEIQFADYKLKTSSNGRYAVESCILKISQIYHDLL